jgi:hypothetical protein
MLSLFIYLFIFLLPELQVSNSYKRYSSNPIHFTQALLFIQFQIKTKIFL